MNEQERKIIKLLLNEMAFEGAINHFEEPPPDVSEQLFVEIKRERTGQVWLETLVINDIPGLCSCSLRETD